MARPAAAPFSRRSLLVGTGAFAALHALPIGVSGAFAANPTGERLHGLSAFGELKYPADFVHFDYVNADAPKGGRFHMSVPNWLLNQNVQTFNTLNTFVLSGDAPPRMELCFDTLMVGALDEPDSLYCHAAEWVELSEDRNTVRFGMRPEARFHDGTAITAGDVAFSLMLLKSDGHPALATALRDLDGAEAEDERILVLRYNGNQSTRAILALAGMPILSERYYTDNPFNSSSLDVPLSSGPYRPERVAAGRFIEYQRVQDYWAADLPTSRGLGNFDVIRIEFFAERSAAFEVFKAGEVHFREEFTAQVWATDYNFPAVEDGRVIKREFPDELSPTMQAWALNQRRSPFDDRRVREAINLCFDFEWTNDKIFYGAYERSQSLFEKSEFKAEGPADAAERSLIESLTSDVPDGIFDEPPLMPVSDGSGTDRTNLRRAVELLSEAGFEQQGGRLVRDGTPLDMEILIQQSIFERLLGRFVQTLGRIGIDATIRLVDPAQYNLRLNDYDFDMVGIARSIGATPTAEGLYELFSPEAGARPGSNNLPGADAPVYDELIEKIARVESRDELVTVMRVLDRVLRTRLDWIPNWYNANHRAAFWDRFGFKEPKPDYGWPVELLWWEDAEKAAAIDEA